MTLPVPRTVIPENVTAKMIDRIDALKDHRYDLRVPAFRIAALCVEKAREYRGRPDRESLVDAAVHQAILAEMLAFKSQLDKAFTAALDAGLCRIRAEGKAVS